MPSVFYLGTKHVCDDAAGGTLGYRIYNIGRYIIPGPFENRFSKKIINGRVPRGRASIYSANRVLDRRTQEIRTFFQVETTISKRVTNIFTHQLDLKKCVRNMHVSARRVQARVTTE